jgi:hypothetical protein
MQKFVDALLQRLYGGDSAVLSQRVLLAEGFYKNLSK